MSGRYKAAEFPRDDRGCTLWGVQDLHNDNAWVTSDDGKLQVFAMKDGAKGWIARQRYLEESAVYQS